MEERCHTIGEGYRAVLRPRADVRAKIARPVATPTAQNATIAESVSFHEITIFGH